LVVISVTKGFFNQNNTNKYESKWVHNMILPECGFSRFYVREDVALHAHFKM
jgi:hypothetical protein